MPTVSVRVPDELKERMDDHPEINWSALLREYIAAELEAREARDLAHAVAVSERISESVDAESVRDQDTTAVVREWRDRRYGPDE